jgi:hypothetical protein
MKQQQPIFHLTLQILYVKTLRESLLYFIYMNNFLFFNKQLKDHVLTEGKLKM